MLVACSAGVAAPETLDDLLFDQFDDDGPAVVLLVDAPASVTEIETIGLADIDADQPVRPDDRFRIGSASKTFTATVILQMVEEGRFDLDDPISRYVSPVVMGNIENADTATIRQLLNMTSGIFDYLGNDDFWFEVEDNPTHQWTAGEVILYADGEESYFATGDDWEYSNTNYILLELLINALGSSYGQEVENRIAGPLGLTETYVEHYDSRPGGTIHSYESAGGGWNDVRDINDGTGLADGGIITTAEELGIFISALVEGDLLSPEMQSEMEDFVISGGEGYGLGLSTLSTDWGDLYGHDGATAGFASEMWYHPDEQVTIIVLYGSEDLQESSPDIIEGALAYVLDR